MVRLLFPLLILSGCSHAHDPEDPLRALSELECEREVKCGETSRSNLARCMERRARSNQNLAASIAAGRVSLDEAALAECLRAQRNLCYESTIADACFKVVTPKVPLGGPCLDTGDCAAGGCACDHTCQPMDGRCDMTCPSGLICLGGACGTRHAEGEACSDSFLNLDCGEGLLCRYQHCMHPPRVGESCLFGSLGVFDTVDCDEAAWCDLDSGRCRARLPEGAACSTEGCVSGTSCVDGTCRPFVDIGAPCDPEEVEGGCAWDAHCDAVTGVCVQFWKQEGESCSEADFCYDGLQCVEGTCRPRPKKGEACMLPKNDSDPDLCYLSHCDPGSHTCVADCSSPK